MDKVKKAITVLTRSAGKPEKGLKEDIFLFASSIVPMINVDLLIRNNKNQTLLTWREEKYSDIGWHIPGGIIRFKEPIAKRIKAVAKKELGAVVSYNNKIVKIGEIKVKRRVRGHCISLLFECKLRKGPDKKMEYKSGKPKPGEWAWHSKCPSKLIKVHNMYQKYIGRV